MKSRLLIFFLTALLMLSISASTPAQKFWEKKPYQQWTLSEVMEILLQSPWAQTDDETVRFPYGETARSFFTIVRLHSALPVRQALLRRKQIDMNYGRFTLADKTRFDNETKSFLECPDCARFYLITAKSPIPAAERPPKSPTVMTFDIIGELKNLSLSDVKPYISLRNDTGESRELVGFRPPTKEGGEATFVFARFDEHGKPLVTAANKKFYFQIDEKLFEKRSVPMKRFTFEVARLTLNGEVVF